MAISSVGTVTPNQLTQQSQVTTAQPKHHHHGHKAQSSSTNTNQQDSVQIGSQQNENKAGTYSNPQYPNR